MIIMIILYTIELIGSFLDNVFITYDGEAIGKILDSVAGLLPYIAVGLLLGVSFADTYNEAKVASEEDEEDKEDEFAFLSEPSFKVCVVF